MSDVLIVAQGISKKFCRSLKRSLWYGMQDLGNELLGRRHGGNGVLRTDEFWALRDVSFELKRGECLGLVGHNGAGKTTLLRMLNGLIKPDQGRIEMRGRVGALIALGAGFNPVLTGRENIYVNASVLGLGKREIEDKLEEIVDFAEIGDFIDTPVQNYSSGMQVRLGFAVATAMEPDILLLDEVLAVGDASFRAKCFSRIGNLLKSASVIFVSHNDAQTRRLCDRAIHLKSGKVQYNGNVDMALSSHRESMFSGQNSQSNNQISWILCEDAVSVKIDMYTDKVKWNECLRISIYLKMRKEVKISKAYVQFYKHDESVAHSENVWIGDDEPQLLYGDNKLDIKIAPLSLVRGCYAVSIALFSSGGKSTIAHTLNAGSVFVEGPLGVGPSVLLPCSWSFK